MTPNGFICWVLYRTISQLISKSDASLNLLATEQLKSLLWQRGGTRYSDTRYSDMCYSDRCYCSWITVSMCPQTTWFSKYPVIALRRRGLSYVIDELLLLSKVVGTSRDNTKIIDSSPRLNVNGEWSTWNAMIREWRQRTNPVIQFWKSTKTTFKNMVAGKCHPSPRKFTPHPHHTDTTSTPQPHHNGSRSHTTTEMTSFWRESIVL